MDGKIIGSRRSHYKPRAWTCSAFPDKVSRFDVKFYVLVNQIDKDDAFNMQCEVKSIAIYTFSNTEWKRRK